MSSLKSATSAGWYLQTALSSIYYYMRIVVGKHSPSNEVSGNIVWLVLEKILSHVTTKVHTWRRARGCHTEILQVWNMPGANCSIVGCPVSRKPMYQGISIFKVPSATERSKETWRNELLNVLTRDRVVDGNFRRQIQEGNLYTCERHFKPEDIEIRKCLWFLFYAKNKHILCGTVFVTTISKGPQNRQA